MSKLLFYCTKSKLRLFFDKIKQIFLLHTIKNNNDLNGKIVAESDFEIEEISVEKCMICENYTTNTLDMNHLLKKSCVTEHELINYEPHYAIHIKNLKIYDKPKELNSCYTDKLYNDINKIFTNEVKIDGKWYRPVDRAPQNMMRVKRVLQEDGILISVRPKHMFNILSGFKDIELRRVILKEMLNNKH